MRSRHLFYEGDLRNALEGHAPSMDKEIAEAPEDHLLQADEDAWVAALVERYSVEAPQLQTEQWWQDPPAEIRYDVSGHAGRDIRGPGPFYVNGIRVVVNTRNWNPPSAEVRDGEVLVVVEYPADSPVDVKSAAQETINSINAYLGWARSDAEQFNSGLAQRARSAIQARRQRVREAYARAQETGIPMRRSDESPKTYIADVLVRRPSPSPPRNVSTAIALEPVISDEEFEHTLGVIRAAGQAMERTPKTYAGMGEEDRRHVLLTSLNTHYKGQTTAEAFNVSGKTDTIDQLFRYAGWRDTKLAVVMFAREKGLTAVVEKGREALAEHEQFVSWRDAASETELRATVSWPGDERRHADLNVFFVHTPT